MFKLISTLVVLCVYEQWERQLGEDNSVLTKITPNECIEVEWHDHDWTANVEVPIEGTKVGGPAVTVKREVKF